LNFEGYSVLKWHPDERRASKKNSKTKPKIARGSNKSI